jgi:hypothetical protein
MNWKTLINRVIRKVTRLGGENGQLGHNRASKAYLGMKILQNEITGTQTSFSTNFAGKLSFILSFLFFLSPSIHCWYIYFHCSYLYNYYNYYSRTLCIKCWLSAFQTEIEQNFLTLQIPLEDRIEGEREGDFPHNFIKHIWSKLQAIAFLIKKKSDKII